jgi:hypothetical protein
LLSIGDHFSLVSPVPDPRSRTLAGPAGRVGRLAATSGLQMMSRQNPAYAAQMAQYGAGDAETPSR